jgi:hypothetical protein
MEPENLVEPDEMVHVGMRDKDVGQLEQTAGAHQMKVTHVEEDRPSFVLEIRVNRRIPFRSVHELGKNIGSHRWLHPV